MEIGAIFFSFSLPLPLFLSFSFSFSLSLSLFFSPSSCCVGSAPFSLFPALSQISFITFSFASFPRGGGLTSSDLNARLSFSSSPQRIHQESFKNPQESPKNPPRIPKNLSRQIQQTPPPLQTPKTEIKYLATFMGCPEESPRILKNPGISRIPSLPHQRIPNP